MRLKVQIHSIETVQSGMTGTEGNQDWRLAQSLVSKQLHRHRSVNYT